jgi:hypothetical protein
MDACADELNPQAADAGCGCLVSTLANADDRYGLGADLSAGTNIGLNARAAGWTTGR